MVRHSSSNLKLRRQQTISPVFAHNATNAYDSHLFIKQFANIAGDITPMSKNHERMIMFSKTESQFKRILLSGSFVTHVKNLGRDQVWHTKAAYTPEQFELMIRKGIYPSEHVCRWRAYRSILVYSDYDNYHVYYRVIRDRINIFHLVLSILKLLLRVRHF